MLNQYLVEKLAREQKIAPLNIIREYLEMETLFYMSQTKLSENIVFYGGTALRLAYQSSRFSEDLDFLALKNLKSNLAELKKALNEVSRENEGVHIEEVLEKCQTIFGLLLIKNKLLKHSIRIKIEISKKKNGIKYNNFLLSSPISEKEIIFPTADLQSLLTLKEKAIQGMSMPRDRYDYWYLSQKLRLEKLPKEKFPFSKTEFGRELKRWLPQNKWKIINAALSFYSYEKN